MIKYLFTLVALVLALSGCAANRAVVRPLDSYAQHYVQFDATLAWDVRGDASRTVVDGVFLNTRYDEMDNVEVWVAALDGSGKTMARAASFIIPHQLRQDEPAPFTVKLPVAAAPGTKLHFTYKYLALEAGGDDGGGGVGNWMQSFDSKIP
jgi:hypothetical protein